MFVISTDDNVCLATVFLVAVSLVNTASCPDDIHEPNADKLNHVFYQFYNMKCYILFLFSLIIIRSDDFMEFFVICNVINKMNKIIKNKQDLASFYSENILKCKMKL